MNASNIFKLLMLAILANLVKSEESRCAALTHCNDINDHIKHKDGDVWVSVNNTENSCAECICMESKEYTVSCLELEVSNKSLLLSVRKHEPLVDVSKGFPKDRKNVVSVDKELSQEAAFKIRCNNGIVPSYGLTEEEVVLKHIHYYYTTRIMYCCKKRSVYKRVGQECKIIFDDLCSPKIVKRDNEAMPCDNFEYAELESDTLNE